MKTIRLGGAAPLAAPVVALGCMHLCELDEAGASRLIHSALELGVNYFDHADIYHAGACEALFGQVLAAEPALRDKLLLQTKCGIVPGTMYDWSREHILSSVEQSLARLHTDHLDVLLMHRPDALWEPEEVAEAFTRLRQSGKVLRFGVSNQNPAQMALFRQFLGEEPVADQLQFSLANAGLVQAGLEVNMVTPGAVNRDGGALDYCRLHGITVQAWSPFKYHTETERGVFIGSDRYPALNTALAEVAEAHGVSPTTAAAAWLLRLPAGVQVMAGTTKPARLAEICAAADVTLTRQEWYKLYLAAGHILP